MVKLTLFICNKILTKTIWLKREVIKITKIFDPYREKVNQLFYKQYYLKELKENLEVYFVLM